MSGRGATTAPPPGALTEGQRAYYLERRAALIREVNALSAMLEVAGVVLNDGRLRCLKCDGRAIVRDG